MHRIKYSVYLYYGQRNVVVFVKVLFSWYDFVDVFHYPKNLSGVHNIFCRCAILKKIDIKRGQYIAKIRHQAGAIHCQN